MRLSPASPFVAVAIAATITLVGGVAVHRAMAAPAARVTTISTLPSLGGASTWLNGTELTTEGLGTLHISVKDEHKRTWARITRLKHKESGAQGVHTPQSGGKYHTPAK